MDTSHDPRETGAIDVDGVPYHIWINDRIGAELKRLRLVLGKTPYALAVSGLIAKQTIVANERGIHSPSLRTLAVHCQRLGTTVEAVVAAACRRGGDSAKLLALGVCGILC